MASWHILLWPSYIFPTLQPNADLIMIALYLKNGTILNMILKAMDGLVLTCLSDLFQSPCRSPHSSHSGLSFNPQRDMFLLLIKAFLLSVSCTNKPVHLNPCSSFRSLLRHHILGEAFPPFPPTSQSPPDTAACNTLTFSAVPTSTVTVLSFV